MILRMGRYLEKRERGHGIEAGVAVSSDTGMINHSFDGSHSMATLPLIGANEASAVMSAESECCCGEEKVRSLS